MLYSNRIAAIGQDTSTFAFNTGSGSALPVSFTPDPEVAESPGFSLFPDYQAQQQAMVNALQQQQAFQQPGCAPCPPPVAPCACAPCPPPCPAPTQPIQMQDGGLDSVVYTGVPGQLQYSPDLYPRESPPAPPPRPRPVPMPPPAKTGNGVGLFALVVVAALLLRK